MRLRAGPAIDGVMPMGSVFSSLRAWARARFGSGARERDHAAVLALQRRFELALEVGGFGVWEFDRPRRTIVADARCLELLGLPEGMHEFQPEDWLARVLQEDRSAALVRARQWLDEPGALSLRFRVGDRTGRLRWLNAEFSRQRDGDGRHVGVLVDVTDDMTLGAERERALRRAELAVSVARGYFFDLDLVSGRLSRDPHAQSLLELPLEEPAVGVEALFRMVPEFARPGAIRTATDALSAGHSSFDLEVPVAGDGDSLRYFRTLAHIERDPAGRPVRIDGMSMEVTESRRIRRELERVSTRFQLAAEAGNLGLYELDLRDNTVVQTPIGARLFGLPSGEPTPEAGYLRQIHAEDRDRVEETFRRAIEEGGGLEMVFRVDFGEGTRWVRSAGRLERNERGRPVRVAGVNWDITADIEARDRIARANDRLGLALAAANASVWEYAGDSDRITWDERGADLYGVDPNREGRRLPLVADEDRGETAERLRALSVDRDTEGFVLEYRIRHPRLGLRWVRCIGRREFAATATGTGTRSVGIDIDVTAERTATEAIEQARQAAEAASRTKSAFLANMSHEIRTPMNAIIGMTGLAHRATSLAQSSSYAAQAHAAARSLLTVLNDVLDFSKIEAGRLDVERIGFDLEAMLGPVLDVAGFAAGEKNLSVMLDVGDGVPARCIGDPARISQILLNLTGNAVKFTEAGFVRLNLRRLDDARLRFEVVDSGMGLTAEQQREIFEPFTQGDPSTSRRFGGTGLGLTICRRLAGLMQGALTVDSAPGRGAVFRLDLPLVPADVAAPIWSALPAPPLLAIAHGDAQARGCLAGQFARLGADPREFIDAADLVAWLVSQPAASAPLVCIDSRLLPEDPSGWLGERRALPCAPRLVLLGRRVSSLPPGESALLEPVLPSALRRVLDPASAAADASGSAVPGESELRLAAEGPGYLAGTDILLVEDNDLNRALVIALLAESGASLRIAHNGVQAVDAVRLRVPDVVLMDIHMPLMDGYAATASIRALGPAGRDLPIIATTADALEADRDRALRAGMNDHLIKPLEAEALIAALMRWSRRRPAARAPGADAPGAVGVLPEAPAAPAGSPDGEAALEESPSLLDRSEGLRGCLGRPALFTQTLKMFVDIYEPVLGQLGGADQDVDPALDLGRLAHTLKGSVRALGMLRLAEVAVAIDAERRAGLAPTPARVDELRLVLALTLEQARAALAELSPGS
jgi:two-component system sensor histidine kinase/response regulator